MEGRLSGVVRVATRVGEGVEVTTVGEDMTAGKGVDVAGAGLVSVSRAETV